MRPGLFSGIAPFAPFPDWWRPLPIMPNKRDALRLQASSVPSVREAAALGHPAYETASLAGLLRNHMDRLLGKRNLNIILIKGFFDLAGKIEFKGPVIILINPRSNNEINT